MVSHKSQISSLTAQNQKMMAALLASGIDVPDTDPSSGEEEKDFKMIANKKNSNLIKTKKRKKS